MNRSGSAVIVAALVVSAFDASSQQLDAEQVPATFSKDSIQIEQSPESSGDTLRVEQPSQTATDICDTAGGSTSDNGVGCDSIALTVVPSTATALSPVKITEDGVFVRIAPNEDDIYDPDEITRRLGSAQTVDPQEFGIGGVATQALDPVVVVEPPLAEPSALFEGTDSLQFDLPLE